MKKENTILSRKLAKVTRNSKSEIPELNNDFKHENSLLKIDINNLNYQISIIKCNESDVSDDKCKFLSLQNNILNITDAIKYLNIEEFKKIKQEKDMLWKETLSLRQILSNQYDNDNDKINN